MQGQERLIVIYSLGAFLEFGSNRILSAITFLGWSLYFCITPIYPL